MNSPMSLRRGAAACAFALGGALVACGGGGGGDSLPTVQVNLSTKTASASYPSNAWALNQPVSHVTATLVNPPTTSVYVVIQDSGHVLSGQASIWHNADGSYTADLYYDVHLDPGTYTGTFQLKLCQDQACNSAYTVEGGSVSYTVTVTQPITFTATVNGKPVTLPKLQAGSLNSLALKEYDVLSLQASGPVSWTELTGGAFADNVSYTSTTWTGRARYGVSQPGMTGDFELEAAYLPDQQFSADLSFTVTQ